MQAPDEFAHLDRAYGIAEGACVAPTLTSIPRSILELSSAFPPKIEAQRRIGADDIWQFMHMPLSEAQHNDVKNEAANMYLSLIHI